MRRFMGIVALVCALGLAFVAIAYDTARWARLIVFFPLWLAGIGLRSERASRSAMLVAAVLTMVLVLLP
jgi:hypothetical protein